jgi:hypothetical protein
VAGAARRAASRRALVAGDEGAPRPRANAVSSSPPAACV